MVVVLVDNKIMKFQCPVDFRLSRVVDHSELTGWWIKPNVIMGGPWRENII